MSTGIGVELERLRKLRGLRRADLAAQLRDPVSPSTIRNIERVPDYNVSLTVLHQMAEVLGARVRISCEPIEDAAAEPEADERCVVDNERFIRAIREQYPDCPLTNSQIGRRMWTYAKALGAVRRMRRKPAQASGRRPGSRTPTITAQYEVMTRDVPRLERFADRLGRAYRSDRGRVIVPLA